MPTPTAPEYRLALLNQRVRRMCRALAALEADKDVVRAKKTWIELTRRLYLAEQLFDLAAVAIAGPQGVGKSTLVAQLYPELEAYLEPNPGRGEQLPVLLREHDGVDVVARVRFLDENTLELQEETLTQPSAVCSRAQLPQQNDVLLDLFVPRRHLGEGQALLLLPGIEKTGTVWDELARYALRASACCVFVTNETRMAQGRSAELLEQVQNWFGLDGGVDGMAALPLVFAITGADQSVDGNAAVRQELLERLKLSAEDGDRCLVTGTSPEWQADWIPKFGQLLQTGLPSLRAMRHAQLADLQVLDEDMADAITSLKTLVADRDALADDEAARNIEPILKELRKATAALRKDFSTALDQQLGGRREKARESVNAYFESREWTDRLKTFIGRDLKEQLAFHRQLNGYWQTDRGLASTINTALAATVRKSFDLLGSPQSEPTSKGLVPQLDAYAGTRATAITDALPKEVLDELRILLHGGADDATLDGSRLKAAVRALPALSLELMRLTVARPLLLDPSMSTRDGGAALKGLVEDLNSAGETQQQIINAIRPLLLLDISLDALTLPELFAHAAGTATATAGATAGATTAGATTAGGAAAGTAATGGLAVSVAAAGIVLVGIAAGTIYVRHRAILSELEDHKYALSYVEALRDATEEQTLIQFDGLMETLVARVEARLRESFHVDAAWGRLQRLSQAAADVQEMQSQLRRALPIAALN